MKHISLFWLVCLLTISKTQFAQHAGNYLYNNNYGINTDRAAVNINTPSANTISLKAEVMMNVKPTSYTAIFSATQTGKDIFEVDSMMAQRIDQVKYALGLMGIPESDVHIDAVSMIPTYAYKLEEKKFSKRSTEVPVGFEMKKNIHILFKQPHLLDLIISEMAFAEIYDMVKVEYNIDGMQSYYEELRKAALEVIDSKELTYESLKMHLDVYSMGDGFNCTYPIERYKSYTAFNSGSSYQAVAYARANRENNVTVNGKNTTVNVYGEKSYEGYEQQFIVQTAEKNKTIFYDRMPYNQFDKVINADTEEPCIQLFYNLQVYYNILNDAQYQAKLEQEEAVKKAKADAEKNMGRRHKARRN
ncbi:MAG: SIMPL domain-containing protein [Flavobacteriales bacterium]|nr:SIMPL domain-containing protein [Flavobacteriales bacterium]